MISLHYTRLLVVSGSIDRESGNLIPNQVQKRERESLQSVYKGSLTQILPYHHRTKVLFKI